MAAGADSIVVMTGTVRCSAVARLDGKVALVTGGGNGIGRACCQRFVEEGASVVIADVLDTAGEEAASALGDRSAFIHLDATSAADNEAAAQLAVDRFGGLDILVTAAGISHAGYRSGDMSADLALLESRGVVEPKDQFLETSAEEWQKVLDVNLTGTLLAVQAAARRMSAGGSIITIASIAAKHPEAGPVAYSVSKAGVWMLTKQAARLLGPSGIRVNAIGPGFIETNMTAILREIPEVSQMIATTLPLRRIGTPREVANTALFLASDESSYFTGEILHPDGGFVTD
jgi:NAD(P)-dependent dehydrogenase (short-subunit alcohol dehydrogenase family)